MPSFKLARLLPDVVITVISISDGIGKGEECWAEHTWEGNVQPGQFILWWEGRKTYVQRQVGVTPWTRDPGAAETSYELP